MSAPKMWTEAEDFQLQLCYYSHTRKELQMLLGRTEGSIRKRCSTLGLNTKKGPKASEQERQIIFDWYSDPKHAKRGDLESWRVAEQLRRSQIFVERLARSMGLTTNYRKDGAILCHAKSIRAKEFLATHEHPRGMKGKHHTARVCQIVAEATAKRWLNMTPLDRELMAVKRNQTCLERYGTGNPSMQGTNGYSRVKRGRREDLDNKFFRSAWEANYARFLNFLKAHDEIRAWEYEPHTFVFHGVTRGVLTYTPDFRVTEIDGSIIWHEVKGWMDAKSKAKLKRMAKFYPDETVIVIGPDEYKALAKTKALYDGWES